VVAFVPDPWKKFQSKALEPDRYFSMSYATANAVMVEPVLLVNRKAIERGLAKPPLVRNPIALSVEDAVTPFAQLYASPPITLVKAPVPVEPAAAPVAVCREVQSEEVDVVPILQPVGNVAVAAVPIMNGWLTVVPRVVRLNCASPELEHKKKTKQAVVGNSAFRSVVSFIIFMRVLDPTGQGRVYGFSLGAVKVGFSR